MKKPMLEHLTNVNVEYWACEGLFRQGRVLDKNLNIVSVSKGKKIQFCNRIIAQWFQGSWRNPDNPHSGGGLKIAEPERVAENHNKVIRMFAHADDQKAARIALDFITQDYPVGARYYAKHKIGIRWPVFKDAVNDTLNDVIAGSEYAK